MRRLRLSSAFSAFFLALLALVGAIGHGGALFWAAAGVWLLLGAYQLFRWRRQPSE